MSQPLQSDLLIRMVGTAVENHQTESLGSITEITRDSSGSHIEYVILRSDQCFGRGERYFAVPASSNFIEVSKTGRVTMRINKDDLQFAEGVSANNCPKPNLKHGQSIYELYEYQDPSKLAKS